MCGREEWVVNERGLIDRADLGGVHERIARVSSDAAGLAACVEDVSALFDRCLMKHIARSPKPRRGSTTAGVPRLPFAQRSCTLGNTGTSGFPPLVGQPLENGEVFSRVHGAGKNR